MDRSEEYSHKTLLARSEKLTEHQIPAVERATSSVFLAARLSLEEQEAEVLVDTSRSGACQQPDIAVDGFDDAEPYRVLAVVE